LERELANNIILARKVKRIPLNIIERIAKFMQLLLIKRSWHRRSQDLDVLKKGLAHTHIHAAPPRVVTETISPYH
jgi:hypothetical protein